MLHDPPPSPVSINKIQASGALSADEIAVLRPSDLSLVEVVSLADLPIPGFPASPTEARQAKPEDGLEEKQEVGMTGAHGPEDGGVEEVAETEDVMEFAYADLGASVAECSSNSELSGGVLQARERERERETQIDQQRYGAKMLHILPIRVSFGSHALAKRL